MDISTALESVKQARKVLENSVWKEFDVDVKTLEEQTNDAIRKLNYEQVIFAAFI